MSTKDPGFTSCYEVGGLCIRVAADLPITGNTFDPLIEKFRIAGTRDFDISLHHHFSLFDFRNIPLSKPVYRKAPWAIYDLGNVYCYLGVSGEKQNSNPNRVAFFSKNHAYGEIYTSDEAVFLRGKNTSLTLFPTDEVFLGRALADHNACMVHSSAMALNSKGLLFVGHSGVGKSTIARLLLKEGHILCDEKNIIRRHEDGWKIYGTWNYSDKQDVSPKATPLKAIVFLEQSSDTLLIPIEGRDLIQKLPLYVIRPLITKDWWEKTLDLVGHIAREVPVYRLRFQKSERVIDALRPLFG